MHGSGRGEKNGACLHGIIHHMNDVKVEGRWTWEVGTIVGSVGLDQFIIQSARFEHSMAS